jgi:uncharacterized membrane protein required for colicin V production
VLSIEQKRNNSQNSGRESTRLERELKKDLIVKREFHPTILLFLILCLVAGSGVHLLIPSYIIESLLFGLENILGYLHISAKITLVTSRVVPTLRRYLVSKHPYMCLDHAIHLLVHHLLTPADHV